MPILDYGQFELEPINNTDANIQDLKKLRRLKFAQEQQSTYGRSVVQAPNQYGESKFDSYITLPQLEDLNQVRAERQPWYEQAGAGLIKGAGLAATTFAITFTSLPYGILSAVGEGKFSNVYDNPISNLYDQFNKSMEEWFPNYYTQEEQNASAFSPKNWFTMNFFADKLLKNAGFIVGAIGSGALVSKGLGALGKIAMAGKYAKELEAVNALAGEFVGQGMEESLAFTKALNQVGKGIKLKNGVQQIGGRLAAAGNEASMEALGTKQQTFNEIKLKIDDKYSNGLINDEEYRKELDKADDYASSAGNVDYLVNLAILAGSDLIQFKKFFGGYKNERKVISDAIRKEGEEFVGKYSTKVDRLVPYFKGMVTETAEEGSQTFASTGAQDFFSRKYDKGGRTDLNDILISVKHGLEQTFGTKEGLEAMLLGGLTGIISGAATGEIKDATREIKDKDIEVKKQVDELNKYKALDIFEKNKSNIENAARAQSIQKSMDKALSKGDIYQFTNLKEDLFKSYVLNRVKNNKFDSLVEELDNIAELPKEELENTYGIDSSINTKTPVQYTTKLKEEAKRLKKIYDSIDTRFGNTVTDNYKEVLFDYSSNIGSSSARMDDIYRKLSVVPELTLALNDYINNRTESKLDEVNKIIKSNRSLVDSTGEDIVSLSKDYIKLSDRRKHFVKLYENALTPGGIKDIEKKINTEETAYSESIKEEQSNKDKEVQEQEKQDRIKKATETKWNKLIDTAVNDKELDSIIDQMDKAGVTTNELLDRVAQKRESLKVTPEQPKPKTESSYEEKVADIERRRKEELKSHEGQFIEEVKTYEFIDDDGNISKAQLRRTGKNKNQLYIFDGKKWNRISEGDGYDISVPIDKLYIGENFRLINTQTGEEFYKELKKSSKGSGLTVEEKINAKYDTELKALNKEKTEDDTVNDTVDVITNSNTYDSNTGDNPPVVDDSNIEINEVNTRDFKRVQAVGLAYRASKFAVKGADAKKITISYEDIDPITLSLSDWNTLQNGDEVELSLDTEFDGNVQVYDNNRRVLNSDGTPLTEKKTYSEIKDEDKPIKVEITKNGVKTKVGYLFTESWAKAITPKGDKYENIANEDDMEGNAEVQINALKKLRAEILKQGADKVHKFKVSKGYGHFAVTTETEKVNGKTRKINKPVNEALPKFAESDYFEGDYQPVAVWSGSEFVIGTNRVFPREAIAISDESWEELTTNRNNRYNGGVFIMVPTAVRGQYLPTPVNIPTIDTNIVDSILFAINANLNKDTETSTKIFNNTGIDIATRNGLRQFISQYIYLSSSEAKGISRGVPRIVFSVADSKIEVWDRGEQVLVVELNKTTNRQENLEKLKGYLALQRMTVKNENINSTKDFGIPSVKTNEEGKQYIDFETTTFNKYALDRLTTDLVELNTIDGTPVYVVQPTIDFIGNITVEPTTPTPTTPITPDDFGDLPEGFFDDVLLTQVGKDTGTIKSENVEGIITPDAVGDEYGGDFSISEGIMSFLPLKGNEEIYKEYNLLSEDGKLKKLPDNAKTKKWVDTLNKSPYYQFRLRHLSDGTYRILIVNPYSDYSPAISEETAQRTKELGKNLLVTDGDYTFGADKQKQIVDNIKFLVYTDLLSLVKEGKRMAVSKAFSNAKESLIKTKKNIEFIANLTEEKFQQLLNNPKAKELYGHIESVEQAKYIASELERITKDEVFKQFEGQVVQDLKVLGITVKEEKLQDLSDEEKDDIVTDEDDAVDEEEQTQNVKSFSVEVFQVNPRNTAGINVKLMLSKIPNSNRNYLGLSSYIPFDTVFDDLTVALSPVEGSLKSYIQEMKNIINGNPAKSYLKNLVEVLESPETATSMKNQFVAVMNKHLGNFVLTLWKRTPNGMEVQTKYANENSAVSVIVNQWAENMGQSRIVTTGSKGNKHIDKTVAAELNDKIKQLQGKGKEAHKEFMLELFDALGIFIDPNIVDVLYNTTQYKELDSKGKRKGNFEYQFTYSSTGVPQGVFSAIVDALNKENSKEIIEAAEDLMQLNNPFDGANKNSSVTFLAQVVAKYSNVHYASSHRNVENKMIYDSSFHIPITSRIKDLNVPNSPTRAILKELPFSSTAYWLSDSAKNIKLIMHDMDGLKERGKNTDGVTRTSMSEREQEFTSIGLFQDTESEHTAKFIGMTMSDKSRTPIIEAPKFKVNINTATLKDRHITKETLTEDSKEQISNLVKAEAARIRNIRQRIKEDIDNKLKNEVGEQYYNGAQFFYFFPELNGLVYKDGKLDDTMLLNENLQVLIDTALDKVVETVNNTIDKWWNIGIVYRDKKNRIATMFNKNYVSNSHLKDNALIAYAATDIELNYIVFNANMMQLVQGDPAKFYNQKKVGKFDVVTRISKVMDEYQKREAKDAAPGEIGTADWEFTDKNGIVRKGRPTYNVVFAADDKFGSITQGYLQTMPSYTEGLDRTDAQELTTLREHIDLLMNHGRIPDDIYASIMKKIEDAGVGGYYELTYDELGMVLGPQKPVQIVSRFDNGVESTFYIKSSSYPLIPQLTRGFGEDSDIEKIRVNMEKNNVDRLAFITATKIGARNTVELFKDGKVVEDLDFSDKLNQLSRKGFTIQQDVPYDPKKHEIVVISQMDRLLMQGLSDVEFEFKGKKLLGKELKKIKENLRGQLMDMSKEDIFDRMGIEMVDGNPVVRNLDKLISILREEAIDRKWAVNDIMALQIVDGNLVIPLTFNNSAERVETLISSLFTKIIKQKISGKSFVQASSSGYKNNIKTLDDLTASDKKGIVFLKGTGNDFNPKTGLTYTNLNEETKEVKVAQVFIPWKYSGNLEDFVKEGTSELDLNKIDPELLKMIGARIPNQGHSSQIVLQVVGFLPKVLGDLVIVPGEITKQMGSDFDVDKLYTYMYNNVVNAEGRLVKVPSAISENGDIDTESLMDWAKDNFAKGKLDFGALSELDEDTDKKIKEGLKLAGLSKKALIKAALQNAYIEVHETVLTNSEVVKKALTPLDADDLSITGDNASTKQDRGLFISRDRQLKDFIRQQAGKSGVAIMSRAVVGGAMIEDYNLRLGTPTEKGYKDTPFKGFLDDSGDAIALINLSGEGKTEFNGEERTKTRNTIIMQSGAVDNANKPVLDSNNLNSFTFNTAIAINRLSSEEGRILDLRYTSYFLNQEVIKDYINELKSLSDTLNEEFTTDRKNAAVEKVKENYLKRAGLKEYKVVGKGFTPQMMLDLIKSNEKNSNEYIKDQLEILEHFVYLDTVGTELNEIYGALSTESKGVGKGYWDVLIRQEQLRKLGRKSTISGAAELLEEGSQANKIAGYVYDAVKVMSQIFPYQTTQVQEIINTIEIYAGKTYTDKNLRQLIWENIKSYIFTHPDLATTPEDRNALFYGENSVAKEIERFKKTPEGFNNRFMQRVRTKLGKTADMPDLVLLNASAAERTDEQEVVKHFVDLLTSPNEGTRELGERLIQYQFATGGLQKALQYVKYIPVSYLATTNFGTKLMEIINSLNDENSINMNAFIEQFYQHNPARARIYKIDITDKILNEGIKFNVETDRVNNLLYTKDNVQDYVPYISIRDKKGNWVLLKKERYEGITLVYKPIAVLGGHGKDYTSYNEYKFDTENVVSTIESNNPKNTILPQSKIVPTTKEEPTITNTEVYTVKGNKYVNPFNASPSENLNFAMANLETERFKALSPLFTNNSNLLSDKFEIIIDNNLEYTDAEGNKKPARGLYYKGKVYLNPKVINNNVKTQGRELTTEDIEKTLMHELGHAYTADLYRIYSEGGTHKLLTSKVKQNFERIDALRNVAYNMLTKEEKEKVNKIKTGKYGTPEQGINNEDLKTYYGFINTKEFISEVLTKPEFQKKLNKMSLNSTTSVFERVVKFIKDIYNEFIKTLGFTVEQNSVLENSLLEVMDLMHNSENVEATTELPKWSWSRESPIGYEVSSKGDKRFSAFNATLNAGAKIKVMRRYPDGTYSLENVTVKNPITIEKSYQVYIKGYNSIAEGKGKPPKFDISREELYSLYKELWKAWTIQNPKLIQELREKAQNKVLTDMFANTDINQARAISEILNEIPTELTEETLPSISEISNKELSLQMSVGDYMKTLTKEQRELLRNFMEQKIIEFRCK